MYASPSSLSRFAVVDKRGQGILCPRSCVDGTGIIEYGGVKATHCFYPHQQNEVSFIDGISERQKSELFVLFGSVVFVGLYLLKKREGRSGRKGATKRAGASCRELSRISSIIVLCYVPGTKWRTGDGKSRVNRKGWMAEGTGLLIFLV